MLKKNISLIILILSMISCCETQLEERTGTGSELKIKPILNEETQSVKDSAKVEMICIDFPDNIGYDSIVVGEDYEKVTATKKVFPYKLAKYELSYNVWRIVYKWATSTERGNKIYKFENPGAEGSYKTSKGGNSVLFNEGGDAKTKGMPVTGISWRDAMVWCNAFSEMCKLIPVYYTDAAFSKPIRNAVYEAGKQITNMPLPYSDLAKDVDMTSLTMGNVDNPYVNKNANGWRLPYDYEWEYAARKCKDGTFISGANAPGDASGIVESSSGEPTLLEQIQGITEKKESSKVLKDYGWSYENSNLAGSNPTAAGWDDSTPVSGMTGYRMHKQGGKKPTDLGFYDMAGNAYEWQFDYGADYDWKYEIHPSRALRGHTYEWANYYFAAAKRYTCPPYVKMGGIRLARNF